MSPFPASVLTGRFAFPRIHPNESRDSTGTRAMRRRRTRLVATRAATLAMTVVGAACSSPTRETPWTQQSGYRWRDLTVATQEAPGFTRMQKTGIQFENTVSDSALLRNRVVGQGAG